MLTCAARGLAAAAEPGFGDDRNRPASDHYAQMASQSRVAGETAIFTVDVGHGPFGINGRERNESAGRRECLRRSRDFIAVLRRARALPGYRDQHGSVESAPACEYYVPPTSARQPASQTVTTMRTRCSTWWLPAQGAHYQWRYNGSELPDAESSFDREHVQPPDAGGFSVLVNNLLAAS